MELTEEQLTNYYDRGTLEIDHSAIKNNVTWNQEYIEPKWGINQIKPLADYYDTPVNHYDNKYNIRPIPYESYTTTVKPTNDWDSVATQADLEAQKLTMEVEIKKLHAKIEQQKDLIAGLEVIIKEQGTNLIERLMAHFTQPIPIEEVVRSNPIFNAMEVTEATRPNNSGR